MKMRWQRKRSNYKGKVNNNEVQKPENVFLKMLSLPPNHSLQLLLPVHRYGRDLCLSPLCVPYIFSSYQKSFVNDTSPFEKPYSVLLEKMSIPTMMDNDASENPLMLKMFNFVEKLLQYAF